MISPEAKRSRLGTAFLTLVTLLSLTGLAALVAWGCGAALPDWQGPASPAVKKAAPVEGLVGPAVETPAVPQRVVAGAAPAVAAIAAPDEKGPYQVGWYATEYEVAPYGVYRAAIYYPAQSEARSAAADASGGPYPGIVAANGYYGADWNITWLPRQLASHGYVALCFTPPAGGTLNTWTWSGLVQSWDTTQWARGFEGGIDELMRQNGLEGSLIRGLLDTGTFGAIGLSMGGGGALEAAGASTRIDAVVGLAPAYSDLEGVDGFCQLLAANGASVADQMPGWLCWLADAVDVLGRLDRVFADVRTAAGHISVPAQVQVGSGDAFILPQWVHAAYADIPGGTSKAYVEINGGSHAGFIDDWVLPFGDSIERFLGGGLQIKVQEQHRVSQKYFVSWFNYYLKGETGYGAYLFGEEARADVESGILSQMETNVSG